MTARAEDAEVLDPVVVRVAVDVIRLKRALPRRGIDPVPSALLTAEPCGFQKVTAGPGLQPSEMTLALGDNDLPPLPRSDKERPSFGVDARAMT